MIRSVLALTRAFVRDRIMRRHVMFYTTLTAMLMAFLGATFLQHWLRENVWVLLTYWAVCAWITSTAALLAIFDILLLRAEARAERRRLETEYLRRGK